MLTSVTRCYCGTIATGQARPSLLCNHSSDGIVATGRLPIVQCVAARDYSDLV
jgi:hypothetical protein